MKTYKELMTEALSVLGPTFLRDREQRFAFYGNEHTLGMTLKGQTVTFKNANLAQIRKMIETGNGVININGASVKINNGIGYFTVGDNTVEITSKRMKEFSGLIQDY